MPLKVIIVGASLGGLAAAIELTRAGNDIEVTEKVQKQLGIDDAWLLVHRVDLHNALREKAEEETEGRKPKIHLSCPVDSVDPSTGTVFLENGQKLEADLVIGADGVHSRTVENATGQPKKRVSTGQNCFRFLVPTEKLQANPITKNLIDRIGLRSVNAFISEKRRLIMYPCRLGTLMNMALFHPDRANEQMNESSWVNSGSQDDLVNEVQGFSPELRELCSMAEDLKLWSLAFRDPTPCFFNGNLALIGDAAHPTLPHQGQGGTQAFEDAATLGALFRADTRSEDVARKLQLYNDVHYRQTVTVLFMLRVGDEHRDAVMGDLRKYVPDAELPENMWTFVWTSFPVREANRLIVAQA